MRDGEVNPDFMGVDLGKLVRCASQRALAKLSEYMAAIFTDAPLGRSSQAPSDASRFHLGCIDLKSYQARLFIRFLSHCG